MKKLILFSLLFFFTTLAIAEAPFSEPTQDPTARYRLFPTQNIYTFLKLDTMTGKIWQVQFSTKGAEYRFESVLSDVDIAELLRVREEVGRYTLFPTQNMYNFILLDQIDGYTYQVQWHGDEENRGVVPISY